MIFLYDNIQTSVSHAPFTRSFTEVVAKIWPDKILLIFARKSHLQEAFRDITNNPNVRLSQELLSEHGVNQTIGDTLRFLMDCRRRACRRSLHVVFLTAFPSHIWACKLFRRWHDDFSCHLVLHGDVGWIAKPRARHPYHRLMDFTASLAHANHANVRFVVLERHIAESITAIIPAVAPYIDVVRHPCAPVDIDWQGHPLPGSRLRLGLLGIAGPAKGLDVFARLARQAASPSAEFRLIGKMQPGWHNLDLGGISGPLPFSEQWLPRDVFESELAALHYVVLPYNLNYYAFAASGVLLDALAWRKPFIALRTPVLVELAGRFGDIGHICANEQEMLVTVRELQKGFDVQQYQTQRRNLDAAYHSRLSDAVAAESVQALRRDGTGTSLDMSLPPLAVWRR